MSLSRGVHRLCSHFNNLIAGQKKQNAFLINRLPECFCSKKTESVRQFQTSCVSQDLMEFFDSKENWGQREVKVGRSWKVEELRIKSNSDLHKLWYVLLKERNMLMTMEHEYNEKYESFPNPERIDKVEESMENLETVVRERNRAYYLLETGETGERTKVEDVNCFGLTYDRKLKEYAVPSHMNKKYLEGRRLYNETHDHKYVKNFLQRFQEKKKNMDLAAKRSRFKVVCGILERFPNVDEEALKDQFPDIDIEEAKKHKLSRSHCENAY